MIELVVFYNKSHLLHHTMKCSVIPHVLQCIDKLRVIRIVTISPPHNYIAGEDFIGGESMIVFGAGEIRACENITIIDDDVMETIEEDFIVAIDEIDPSPLDPVIGVNSMVPVTIIDDDGKFNIHCTHSN